MTNMSRPSSTQASPMSSQSGSHKVVYAALIGNGLVAISKFIAAVLTGSSAMFSEGVHSTVDTCNQVLLLYGLHRADKPADPLHPFGYGRELYFWSLIVALLVLAVGTGVSLFEGISHIRHPEPIEDATIAYVVLGLSAVFEGGAWWAALREFRKYKGDMGYYEAFKKSKDPSVFTVLVEDSAALLGIAIAFCGILGAHVFHAPVLDGMASIGIALVLATMSLLLVRESKRLLIGEPAHPHVRDSLLDIATADPDVRQANGVFTVQMGHKHVVATLSLEFEDKLTVPEVEACIRRIEDKAKDTHASLVAVFVKPQTPEAWRSQHGLR